MTNDERLTLARYTRELEYRLAGRTAWLKVFPTAWLRTSQDNPDALLDKLLRHQLPTVTPEDTGVDLLGPWERIDRMTMLSHLDIIIARSEQRIADDDDADAEAKALAEEGGYEHTPLWTDCFRDYTSMRRWFADELWPEASTTFWVETAVHERVIVAADALLIGIIWIG